MRTSILLLTIVLATTAHSDDGPPPVKKQKPDERKVLRKQLQEANDRADALERKLEDALKQIDNLKKQIAKLKEPNTFASADHPAHREEKLTTWPDVEPADKQPGRDYATINVRTHPDATITIDDYKSRQYGPERTYYTPALPPGRTYIYKIKIEFEDGDTIKKDVEISAGKTVTLEAYQK